MWVNHFWKDAKARICLKYKNNGSYNITLPLYDTICRVLLFKLPSLSLYSIIDVIFLNMAHNVGNYYDFVYSNGTKVISGVSGVELVDISGQKYPLFLSSDGSANVVAETRSGNGALYTRLNCQRCFPARL